MKHNIKILFLSALSTLGGQGFASLLTGNPNDTTVYFVPHQQIGTENSAHGNNFLTQDFSTQQTPDVLSKTEGVSFIPQSPLLSTGIVSNPVPRLDSVNPDLLNEVKVDETKDAELPAEEAVLDSAHNPDVENSGTVEPASLLPTLAPPPESPPLPDQKPTEAPVADTKKAATNQDGTIDLAPVSSVSSPETVVVQGSLSSPAAHPLKDINVNLSIHLKHDEKK